MQPCCPSWTPHPQSTCQQVHFLIFSLRPTDIVNQESENEPADWMNELGADVESTKEAMESNIGRGKRARQRQSKVA